MAANGGDTEVSRRWYQVPQTFSTGSVGAETEPHKVSVERSDSVVQTWTRPLTEAADQDASGPLFLLETI